MENWYGHYSSDAWKTILEQRVQVGRKFKRLANQASLLEDAQREVLLQVQLCLQRHKKKGGDGISPDSVNDEFMLERFDSTYWQVRYSSESWIALLRHRIRSTRGEIPGLEALVDDVQQDVMETMQKSIAKHRVWVAQGCPSGSKEKGIAPHKVSDALMLTTFGWRYNDYIRKFVFSNAREPEWLVEEVGSQRLAHDIFVGICRNNEKVENVVDGILRWVEIGERRYTLSGGKVLDEDLIGNAAEKLRDQRLTPPLPSISLEKPPTAEFDDGERTDFEFESLERTPPEVEEVNELVSLARMLVAENRDRVQPRFLELHEKFRSEAVLDNFEKQRLRLQILNPDRATDLSVAAMMDEAPQNFRRRRDKSLAKIGKWLADNGFKDLFEGD